MNLTRELTNQLFHLAQVRTGPPSYGVIGAESGTPRACFPLSGATVGDAIELMAQLQAEGLSPFATFALAEDLSAHPERPDHLALPSLPTPFVQAKKIGQMYPSPTPCLVIFPAMKF